MPELPEVETIKRELASRLRGRVIERVVIPPDPRGCRVLRRYPSPRQFCRRLAGRRVEAVERRAKYLLLTLDDRRILIFHLGMSGQLLFRASAGLPLPHTRLILRFVAGEDLCFVDPRKFGEAYLFSEQDGDILVNPFLLGPEPLAGDYAPAVLEKSLRQRRGAVKAVLLDQKTVAGLGNIYTDEALFRAGVHPLRTAGSLTGGEIARLFASIREVLQEAIRRRGTSASDGQYVNTAGQPGSFQKRLRVYQRAGKPCPRCGGSIETARIAGRTAHFCSSCQPSERPVKPGKNPR